MNGCVENFPLLLSHLGIREKRDVVEKQQIGHRVVPTLFAVANSLGNCVGTDAAAVAAGRVWVRVPGKDVGGQGAEVRVVR